MMKCLTNCFRFRFLIVAITFFTNVSLPLSARNMIYAIQPMLNHTAIAESSTQLDLGGEGPTPNNTMSASGFGADICYAPSEGDDMGRGHTTMPDGPYTFGDSQQAIILSTLAIGQLIGTLCALFIYDFCYVRPLLTIFLVWTGLLNVLLPFIAKKAFLVGILTSRLSIGLYIGIMTPVNVIICSTWFPENEKIFVLTLVSSGQNAGNILFSLAGHVNESIGWEFLFYIPGSLTLLCGFMLAIFYNDEPLASNFLSEEEKSKLSKENNSKTNLRKRGKVASANGWSLRMFNISIARHSRKQPAPWFKALGTIEYWAILSGTFGQSWASEATLTYTQIYLTEVHNYSLSKTSLLNSLPTNISMVVFGVLGSKIAEYCIHEGICKKITMRRIGGCILWCTGIYFVLLGVLPCKAIDDSIIALLVFSSFRAGAYVSIQPAFRDISPKYQDSLTTLSMVVGFLPGFIVPAIIGFVGKETRHEWMVLFSISASVIFVSVGFFIFAVKPEEKQFEWKTPQSKRKPLPSMYSLRDTMDSTPKVASEYASNSWPGGLSNLYASSQRQNEDIRTVAGRHVSRIQSMMIIDEEKK